MNQTHEEKRASSVNEVVTPEDIYRMPEGYKGRAKNYPVSIAPMMDWTDRHYRYMMRLITKKTLLYTEMIAAEAIIRGDKQMLLDFQPIEHPIAVQLGGSDPDVLAKAAVICEDWGYDEIDLNVGCPSSRVQEGRFGACLMAQPDLVAECVEAMRSRVKIPVTVKHRIGIDSLDKYEDLLNFVERVAPTECDRFTVHARIAILGGLNPKQNRTIPPLRYEDVYALKEQFPELCIEINGGIKTYDQMQGHLDRVDAVMLGRAAYEDPFMFAKVDELFFGEGENKVTRRDVVEAMVPYIERDNADKQLPIIRITRHMLGLFRGQRGARYWRRSLSEKAKQQSRDPKLMLDVLDEMGF
tara:strand:- start:6354 stop:7418 length:1065 start_codon:yes stop_codon:yes gene_type:complete